MIKKGAAHPTNFDAPLTGMKIIVDAGNGSGRANHILPATSSSTFSFIARYLSQMASYDAASNIWQALGSGGFFAEHVLQALGADTAGSQFLDPDGTFPNHSPNPEAGHSLGTFLSAGILIRLSLKPLE